MSIFFEAINNFFDFIVPIADFLWDFPTNFQWYTNIPVLGNFTFAIIILMGSGVYFTIRTSFVQITGFKKGLKILVRSKTIACL